MSLDLDEEPDNNIEEVEGKRWFDGGYKMADLV